MRLLKFIPIKLTLFLVLGILLGYYFSTDIQIAIAITVLSILILGILFYKQRRTDSIAFGTITMLTTICMGILSISLWQPKNRLDHYSHQDLREAHTWHIKIQEVLKSTTFSDRYIGIIKNRNNKKASGKLILNFSINFTTQQHIVDDELIIHTKLDDIRHPLNLYQFNYKNYLSDLGIYHQVQLKPNNYFALKNTTSTVYGIAASIRNNISSKLKQANFGTNELGIIQALLLGQRNDISEATYNNYKNAGAVHILAVSGLHIGIILLLLQFVLQPIERLPKGKTLKLITIVILLWGFALLAGFSASVVRAVTMFSFVAYALYLNRPSNTFNILALSMFAILLLINPMLIFHVGFQMSYAAVFAILWVYPLLQRFWFPKNILIRKIWQLLSVSIAAQVGVLPISLFYFHQFPGLFFVSNLLIVPFLGLILGMGILVILLALLNALPDFLVNIYDTLIHLMNQFIAWIAQQEGFLFQNISFDSVQLITAYGVLITLILALTKSTYKRTLVFLCCLIGFQLWTFYSAYDSQKKEQLFVAHQTKNSILLHQKGNLLSIFSTNENTTQRLTTNYAIAERIESVANLSLENSYTFEDGNLIIIDSLGVYPSAIAKPDYLLLTQSPKINLERLIDSLQPKYIIADGSNYKTYIKRWAASCKKRKLPFHYTGEKGAYYIKKKILVIR